MRGLSHAVQLWLKDRFSILINQEKLAQDSDIKRLTYDCDLVKQHEQSRRSGACGDPFLEC